MSENPLLNFARTAELTVKLPSNGKWYEDGFIQFTPTGEAEVFPMLPKDELQMLNPDALLSGQANINLIKSCVPAIKTPSKLLYPDLNVLLLAIHRATYGNKITMQVTCPNCIDKANERINELEAENAKKEKDEDKIDIRAAVAEDEKDGKYLIHQQEISFEIDPLLQGITTLKEEYVYTTDKGLKIYIQPNTLEDRSKYGAMSLIKEKLLASYKGYRENENLTEEEAKKIADEMNKCYAEMADIGNQLITASIIKIELPNGSYVDNKDYILEFIQQTPSTIVGELNDLIKEVNSVGLPETLEYECSCCHHKWKDRFFGFNQSDFFGKGSSV